MILRKSTEAKLRAWLGASTWHTSDLRDLNRWFDFVDQYQRDHGYVIDESDLQEHIEHQIEGGVDETLRDIIRERISLAYQILDFLKRTGR